MVVDPKAFESFLKQELEELTGFLLRAERDLRFEPGTIEVTGPAPEDLADGGKDLLVEISGAATTKVHDNLIPDVVGTVWYSCKSTKSSKDTWTKLVRDDVDEARVYNAKTGEFHKDAEERAREDPPNPLLISAMASGAHYWIVVNVGAANPRAFEAEIEKRLEWYVERFAGTPQDLKGRVRVCDANRLAAAYGLRPVTLPSRLERMLGARAPTFLLGWDKWTERFESERRDLSFRADDERRQLIEELEALLAGGPDTVLRLAGPPGVGKTRLIHHVLSGSADQDLRARVRYALEPKGVTDWLRDGGLDSTPNLVLVVDEVIADRASSLARAFGAAAAKHPEARLVIVGPQDDGYLGEPHPLLVSPLDDEAMREVVRSEMTGAGTEDTALERTILTLCEGYPLFALWLCRALADSPALLADPASSLTLGEDPWIATSLVLAGPRDVQPESEWKTLADHRAKALLFVVLTGDENSEAFDIETRTSFESALDIRWSELHKAVSDCRDRGLIRRVTDDRAYISPANLERLVLNHFFGGRSPPLPPKNIHKHLQSRFERLQERAHRTQTAEQTKQNLAKEVLDSLTLSLLTREPKSIRYAVRKDPERGALALRPLVRIAFEATDERAIGVLAGLFNHLSFRRVSVSAFAAIEESLFKLSEASDRARTTWNALFNPAFHLTRQSFATRFKLLDRRLTEGTREDRVRAVDGLSAAVARRATRGLSVGWDDVDGPIEHPTNEELAAALRAGWDLLLRTCGAQTKQVAAAARSVVAKQFRGGVRYSLGAGALNDLAESAKTWTREQRARLAEKLDDVERYERANDPRVASALGPALDRLQEILSPRDLWERVLARVGRWHPGTEPVSSKSIDDKDAADDIRLASELVQHPHVLFDHLEWLTSEKAVRAVSFARALGSADPQRALFPGLRQGQLNRRHEEFVAHYVVGWASTTEEATLDDWLEELLEREDGMDIVSRVIAMLPGTDRRAQLLLHAIQREEFSSAVISGLGYWRRTSEAGSDAQDKLISALSAADEPAKIEALGLVRERLLHVQAGDGVVKTARQLAIDLVNARLHSPAELAWADIAIWLVKNGQPGVLTAAALSSDGGHDHYRLERAVHELSRAGFATAVWRELAEAIDQSQLCAIRLRWLLQQTRLLQNVPDRELRTWIRGNTTHGLALATLASPYAEELDSASRLVLEEFGADSAPARELLARVASTPRAVNSFATFFAGQAANAEAWASSESSEVRAWAAEVRQLANERAKRHRAEEAFEARYGS